MSRRFVSTMLVALLVGAALGTRVARAQDAGVPIVAADAGVIAALAGVPATPEEAAADSALATSPPTDWLTAGPRGCMRRGPMRGMCNGPRRVARPSGPDAERARTLGLGATGVASRLLVHEPDPSWVAAAQTPGRAMPSDLLFPVAGGGLWRGYGATRRNRRAHNHQGVDIGSPAGTLYRAVNDGLVAYSDNGLRGYGNLVILVHPDGSATFYAHSRAAYVFAGQLVRRGQVLGEVGDTGYARGEHLHFEWHASGVARNPLPHFAALPAGVTPTAAQLTERVLPLDRSVFRRTRTRRRVHRGQHPAAPARLRSRRAP